jgi:protein ImuA
MPASTIVIHPHPRLEWASPVFARRTGDVFTLGAGVHGGAAAILKQGAVHEIYAASIHGPAADGFGLAMALRVSNAPLIWICGTRDRHENGDLYGAGLTEWGLAPEALLLVRVTDARSLLAAGEEALRSGTACAVVMSHYGEARAFTLTASRRLALAAQQGRTTAILIRAGARPQPSAAETRWSVEGAPSQGLEARAPGRPAFKVSLLRSRAGLATGEWIMEWDRESRSFVEPEASGRLVPVSARRPVGVRAA